MFIKNITAIKSGKITGCQKINFHIFVNSILTINL